MGDYSVPKEIRDLRPQGTMVKKITDGFYVYKYENFKDENGRWKTRSGECIGRITAGEGFIPNEKRLRSDKVSCRDFGGYRFVTENTAGVLEQLKKFFWRHQDRPRGEKWTVRNTPKYVRQAAEKVGFDIPKYYVK